MPYVMFLRSYQYLRISITRVLIRIINIKQIFKYMATSDRGFASMDPKKQKAIASKGGKTVSQDREHMAEIGRKGGKTVSQDRQHMSEIGRKGGQA